MPLKTNITPLKKKSYFGVVLLYWFFMQESRSHMTSIYLLQTPGQCKIWLGFIPLSCRSLNKGTVSRVWTPIVSFRRKWRETKGGWNTLDLNCKKLVWSWSPQLFTLWFSPEEVPGCLEQAVLLDGGAWINSGPCSACPGTFVCQALVMVPWGVYANKKDL